MAKRIEPWNPNTADWLVAQRGKRTQDEVVDELAARGVQLKRAWLSRIENGAPFSRELLEAFQAYYGSVPPPYEPPIEPPADQSDLVSAIRAQTDAINALVAEMKREREDGRDVATAFDTAATRLLQALRLGGSGGSVKPPVPDGTKG